MFERLIYLIIIVCLSLGLCYTYKSNNKVITQTDTIYIDSIRIVEKTKIKYVTHIDTFYIKGDTVWLKDLPIEHKTYKDTIFNSVIKLDYSGFNASVDNIQIKTKPQRKPFGWSISVGPYIGYGTDFKNLGPSVGVSLQFGWGYRFK